MKTSLVTDSTSDIPQELAEQLGIEIIPATINIAGKSLLDGIEISRDVFYNRLPDLVPSPTTAAPSVGSFQERYERLLGRGADFIVSVHAASNLSGIYNSARLAAESFGQRVKVLDSGQVSLGLGFQVLQGAEAALKGALVEEVLQVVADIRQRVRLAALLDSMVYIRRSGRVSWALAKLGGLLHLKPLVGLKDGAVLRLGHARTRLQGIETLMEILNSWNRLDLLAVLHTNLDSIAHELKEKVREKVSTPILLVNVTTVIGTHVGPGALGFVAVPSAG